MKTAKKKDKKKNKVMTSFRIDEAILKDLARAAKKKKTTRTAILEDVLKDHLKAS